VESAACLLRTRSPDPSVTPANAWTARELLHDEARRGRARIERYRSDLRGLSARRLRARRDLRLEIAAEQAGLRRLADQLKDVREVQEHLDQLRTRRRLWEAQPDHVETLAAGELSAERLRLLEFGALLHLEAAPPPYLQATIGRPFSPKEPVARRVWLKAAWTIEQLRADRGISDPDVAIGLEPTQADARHLDDLVHQTLSALNRDLARLRATSHPHREIATGLPIDDEGRLLSDLGL
jgi:hypothetical protein